MPRKKKEFKYVKKNDGRKNNGRKKGATTLKKTTATPSAMNQAKKDRIGIYALNAMKEIFGSEDEAWKELAKQAKDGSFPHFKLLMEYKYGRPGDHIQGKPQGIDINIKNLFAGTQAIPEPADDIIDITDERNDIDSDEEED